MFEWVFRTPHEFVYEKLSSGQLGDGLALYVSINCLNENIPEDLEEAIDVLFNLLTCAFGRMVLKLSPSEFSTRYYTTLGLYIRNCFKLWHKNHRLLLKLGSPMPDLASKIIMEI